MLTNSSDFFARSTTRDDDLEPPGERGARRRHVPQGRERQVAQHRRRAQEHARRRHRPLRGCTSSPSGSTRRSLAAGGIVVTRTASARRRSEAARAATTTASRVMSSATSSSLARWRGRCGAPPAAGPSRRRPPRWPLRTPNPTKSIKTRAQPQVLQVRGYFTGRSSTGEWAEKGRARLRASCTSTTPRSAASPRRRPPSSRDIAETNSFTLTPSECNADDVGHVGLQLPGGGGRSDEAEPSANEPRGPQRHAEQRLGRGRGVGVCRGRRAGGRRR